MTALNTNGTLSLTCFATPLSAFTTDTNFQVLGTKVNYRYDAENKPTDEIEGVSYRIAVPSLFGQLTLKVLDAKKSLISEKLLAQESEIYITLKTDNVILKPYRIEFNNAYFTTSCLSADISLLG